MAKVGVIASAILLLIGFAAIGEGANKTWPALWPDYSCHPSKPKSSQLIINSIKFQTHQWNSCIDDEQRKGRCAKICFLAWNALIHQYSHLENIVTFDVDNFVDHLVDTNGMSLGDATRAISLPMAKCKRDHPEIPGMWMELRNSTCEIWEPILACIEKAWGCGK